MSLETVTANTSYAISETQHGGYALTSLTCVDATDEPVDTPVVPNEGDDITCTLVNDDMPIDLELTKSDGNAEPLAGETFTYTLTISNLGTRDADLGEPVVVTDVLPTGVLWVLPLPANCSADGQVVTCTLNPADLQVGESVVISLQAMITDIAAPATFTNKAFVTTIDDPACVHRRLRSSVCIDHPWRGRQRDQCVEQRRLRRYPGEGPDRPPDREIDHDAVTVWSARSRRSH